MKRTLIAAVALAFVLGACDSQSTLTEAPLSADRIGAPEIAASGAASKAAPTEFAPAYILLGKGNKLSKNIEAEVEAAGGVLTGRIDAIGVAFAVSTDPAFPDRVKGVQEVVADAFVAAKPAQEAAFDEATAFDAGPLAGIGADEPFFPYLWGVRAVDAPAAWEAGVRGEGVVVAVLDEGFGLDHPDVPYRTDLAQSFTCWTVIDGVAYLSDDPADCEPTQYVLDDVFSHGSHVAGTIAAKDNGLGVIGVAPEAEIMPVKVLSEVLGGGATSWIMQGIVYATDNGADVINMSLGGIRSLGQGKGTSAIAKTLNAYRRAVGYAVKNGVTVVVAAGNDAIDADGNGPQRITPADFEKAVTISATAPEGFFDDPAADPDVPASYTNYGTSLVDFAAPGGDFDNPSPYYYFDMVLSTGASGYYFSAGTSMASPHAAGVAALIISENGGSMKPSRVEAEMRKRAVDLGKPGNDDYYGQGRVSTGY